MGLAAYDVTAEDKAQFDKDGYWISPKLLDDATIAELRRAHERIWSGDLDGEGYPMYGKVHLPENPLDLRKLDNGWWVNDAVKAVVTDPVLGRIAAELLGVDSIRLWHDQVLYKPGTNGEKTKKGTVGWHQDYGYWRCTDNYNMITAWIALQDTDLSNGCMMTIPGSHKWGVVEGSDTFFEQDNAKLRERFMRKDWVEEPCILKAGQISFHHALTFHGSEPNLSSEPRLSVVAHLMPGNTGYRKGGRFHPNIPFLGPRPYDGQPFASEHFPLIYSRS